MVASDVVTAQVRDPEGVESEAEHSEAPKCGEADAGRDDPETVAREAGRTSRTGRP